mmetsp:Transcript_294/g.538  ORF Transcript_294/g.538 Transcript_294/m.538 type:complete len:95 (-) Transcript_294:1016-1300(-)
MYRRKVAKEVVVEEDDLIDSRDDASESELESPTVKRHNTTFTSARAELHRQKPNKSIPKSAGDDDKLQSDHTVAGPSQQTQPIFDSVRLSIAQS